MKEKLHVVLVTRYFPPEISGGARRPFLFVKHLRAKGHKVTVVTPFGDPRDPDHIKVPHPVLSISDTENRSAKSSQTIRTNPIRNFARQWLLWPEPEIRWTKSVFDTLRQTDIKADWLITTSPPESLNCIGAELAKHIGAKWLAEFRDTWLTNPHRRIVETSFIRQWGENRIARHSLKNVDAISAVSEYVMQDIQNLAPKDALEFVIGHFSEPLDVKYKFRNDDVNLVHAGGFTMSDRHRHLTPVLNRLGSVKRRDIHFHILGPLSESERAQLSIWLSEHNFKTTWHGKIPLKTSQAMQSAASALLLVTPENSHVLPGKFSEYRIAGKPIFYTNDGPWRMLVDDLRALNPLIPELDNFDFTRPIPQPQTSMTATFAVDQLIGFLTDI